MDVATSSFTYDSLSRLTALTHSHASNTLAGYLWTYDALSRVTHMESVLDGESDYTYDATSQLVGADHDYQTDEEYSFDANGNRNGTGEEVGAGNRPITDGVFNFTYDIEGNLIAKQRVSGAAADDYRTEYGWDHRNRLTSVTFKDNAGAVTKYVETVYDVFDRRIGKRVDNDGNGVFDRFERFVYDGDDVVLDFIDPDGAGAEPLELATRYLQGPAVDQILAQEDVASGDVLWQLADNLGSVRDLVDSDGDLVAHYVYDSFGNLVDGADGQTRYLYTGREWDADIGLQYNRARWYDPALGRWLSEDPIGFLAGDPNVGRYVGNSPTGWTDPSGLEGLSFGQWMGAVGAGFVGAGKGAVNIVVGVGKVAKETGAQGADIVVGTVETAGNAFGANWKFRTFSQTGRALGSGDVSAGTYYAELGKTLATAGTYNQVQALNQYLNGEITADEASERIGSTAVFQALMARAMARNPNGIGNVPIRQLPRYVAEQCRAPAAGPRFGIPVLRQGSIREMFGELQSWMRANRNANQAQLDAFFEGMARQISNGHPTWQAGRIVLSDGTIAFVGRDAANIFAIRPNGQMLQSNPAIGALRMNPKTGQFELIYSAMRVIE